MGIEEIVAQIQANTSFKFTTQAGLAESVLNEDQYNRFIEEAEENTVILPESRFYQMVAQKRAIDRISLPGRVMRSGSDAGGGKRNLARNEYAQAETATNHLDVNEMVAVIELGDDSLLFNIEQGTLESHLLQLFGRAGGRDLEEYAVFADTDFDPAVDLYLSKTDGWAKRAAQKLYGMGTAPDFNEADEDPLTGFPNNMFQAMFESIENRYIGDRSQYRIWVSGDIFDRYHEQLRRRANGGAAISEGFQTGYRNVLPFKGFPVVEVPVLDRSASVAAGGAGRVAMFGNPDNLAWGVKTGLSIEPDRIPKSRQTDFVMTAWADADYENENAACSVFLDQSAPTAGV